LDRHVTNARRYLPSPDRRVREQVERYEVTDGVDNIDETNGLPIVIVHVIGAKTGALRKVPLVRVREEGHYLLVASAGGASALPHWFANVSAHPEIEVYDGATPIPMRARVLTGDEYELWWARAVAVYPRYREYREMTEGVRDIPLVLAEARPRD
jgi:F420H(2)-dependent quinone reductase